MGYNITIGNLIFNSSHDLKRMMQSGNKDSADIEDFYLDSAPAYSELTDYTSCRWPSYTGWKAFCDYTGLNDLFFNKKSGLMKSHPGYARLTQEHKNIIDMAYKAYKKKYPRAVARFYPNNDPKRKLYPEHCHHLARLTWLKFWVDYVLENCENPGIHNT